MTVAAEGGMKWHGRTLKMALARCSLLFPLLLAGGYCEVGGVMSQIEMAEGGEGSGSNGGVGCGIGGVSTGVVNRYSDGQTPLDIRLQ